MPEATSQALSSPMLSDTMVNANGAAAAGPLPVTRCCHRLNDLGLFPNSHPRQSPPCLDSTRTLRPASKPKLPQHHCRRSTDRAHLVPPLPSRDRSATGTRGSPTPNWERQGFRLATPPTRHRYSRCRHTHCRPQPVTPCAPVTSRPELIDTVTTGISRTTHHVHTRQGLFDFLKSVGQKNKTRLHSLLYSC